MICRNNRQFGAIICQLHLRDACFVEAEVFNEGVNDFPYFLCTAEARGEYSWNSHIAAHICHLRGAAVTSAFLQAPMGGPHYATATESK